MNFPKPHESSTPLALLAPSPRDKDGRATCGTAEQQELGGAAVAERIGLLGQRVHLRATQTAGKHCRRCSGSFGVDERPCSIILFPMKHWLPLLDGINLPPSTIKPQTTTRVHVTRAKQRCGRD